jgi:hypothetical protein
MPLLGTLWPDDVAEICQVGMLRLRRDRSRRRRTYGDGRFVRSEVFQERGASVGY